MAKNGYFRPMDRQKAPVSQQKQRVRRGRTYLFLAGLVVVVPVVAVGVFVARFNPSAYAPQIVAAVQKATGHTLTINGPISLQASLTPTIALNDLTLSNPSGFASPNLMTLKQMQVKIALLPLLHHRLDILSLTLVEPKLYLERNQAGQADWAIGAPEAPQSTASDTGPSTHEGLALQSVSVEDGEISLPASPGQTPTLIKIDQFTGRASSLTMPLHVSGQALVGTTKLTIQGVVGPVAGLVTSQTNPWPVDLTLAFAGATAKLHGQITNPQAGRGYDLAVTAQLPNLATFASALPSDWQQGLIVPALQNVAFSAVLKDQGTSVPGLQNIILTAGASDLSALRPGLSLTSLTLNMPSLTGAGTLNAQGALQQLPWQAQANFTNAGAFFPAFLLPPASSSEGVSGHMTVNLGTAQLRIEGGMATPRQLSGVALVVGLTAPDLSALSGAMGEPLPAWKNIALKTTLMDPGGQGLLHGIQLQNLTATMDNASLAGNASLTWGQHPKLNLNLNITQANIDALRAALPAPAPTSNAAAPQPGSMAAPEAPALPLSLLRQADADITLSADSLTYDHFAYTSLQLHATLQNGLLTVTSFSGQVPGGAVTASGSLDASVDPAAATLKLNAPALALAPLLQAFGLPADAQGMAQVALDLSARGNTLPAMLGTISGTAGLASVNDVVDAKLVNQLFGPALHNVGAAVGLESTTAPILVRCAALRLDAQNGMGTLRAFTFDSNRLLLTGGGTMNFAAQTLGLVLKPQIQIGHDEQVVPISVEGRFSAPHYGLASGAALQAAAQTGLGNMVQKFGSPPLLGQIVGALTGRNPHEDVCTSALQLARMGQPGPAPDAAFPASSTPVQPQGGPQNLLNALLK